MTEDNTTKRPDLLGNKFSQNRVPWNKGLKGVQKAWNKGISVTEEIKEKMRLGNINRKRKPHSQETKDKIGLKNSISLKGKKQSKQTIEKRIIVGDKHWNWQGGITDINEKVRKSKEYKGWRNLVFIRDEYTCVICKSKSGNGKHVELHADHIKKFADHVELRFDVNNGRTLCIDCHKKTDTWGRPRKQQLNF